MWPWPTTRPQCSSTDVGGQRRTALHTTISIGPGSPVLRVRFDGASVAGWDGGGAAVVEADGRTARRSHRAIDDGFARLPIGRRRARQHAADGTWSFQRRWDGRAASSICTSWITRVTRIRGAVLPLDYEFWSPDHRRFTVFFDPGRVSKASAEPAVGPSARGWAHGDAGRGCRLARRQRVARN